MKFRAKLTIAMVLLLSLTYGIGGSLMIAQSFSSSIDRERDAAVQTYRMVVDVLDLLGDNASPGTAANTVALVLHKLGSGGSSTAARIRFGTQMTETGDTVLLDAAPEPADDDTGVTRIVRAGNNRHYLMLSAAADGTAVTLAFDVTEAYTVRQTQQRAYHTTFVILIAIGAAVSWVTSYLLTRPLGTLSRASRELARGNLSYRAPVRSHDEVGQLAADFNRMAGQLEQNVNRIQESMALQERFMADFSHEMKTPMTSIIGYADLLRSQVLTTDEQMDAANYIFSEGKRLEALGLKLLDMLSLDRSKLQLVPASPADLVAGLLEHLKRVYAQKGIALQYRTAEGTCFLEPDLFKTLLVNLMDNARKALDNGGYIYVWQEMLPDGCRVRVLDNGRGIPPEALAHLTEAFYRVDKSRSRAQGGAGLGLSLCNEIVQLHGGTMQFESRVGNGTVVTVELKLAIAAGGFFLPNLVAARLDRAEQDTAFSLSTGGEQGPATILRRKLTDGMQNLFYGAEEPVELDESAAAHTLAEMTQYLFRGGGRDRPVRELRQRLHPLGHCAEQSARRYGVLPARRCDRLRPGAQLYVFGQLCLPDPAERPVGLPAARV